MDSDSSKQIQNWQEKVKASFGDEAQMQHYLFETLDNFFYRYLETSESTNLKTQELAPHLWGAISFENSMVNALKTTNPLTKPQIIELAKRVPKAQKPLVRYGLWVQINELKPEHGKIIITSEVSWDFPEFTKKENAAQKKVVFEYSDLGVFRKELALKLEEACEIF